MKNVFVVLLALAALPAFSAVNPHRPPNLDAFLEQATALEVPAAKSGRIAHVEERLGVPTFFWAARNPPAGPTMRALGLNPEQAARRHLLEHGELWRQDPGLLAENAVLHRVHDTGFGAVIVSFRKHVDGVRVFRDEIRLVMDRSYELVAISGYLPPYHHTGLPNEAAEFRLSHATAITSALFDLTGLALEPDALRLTGRVEDEYVWFDLVPDARGASQLQFSQPARARRVLFTMPEGLAPAYYVEVDVEAIDDAGERHERAYSYVLSAVDGRVLFRKDLVSHASYTYRAWADADGHPWDGPQGTSYSPHPAGTPNGAIPQLVAQDLITIEHGPISTGDAWLPANATASVGNNVDAYADLFGDGFGTGDIRAQVSSGALDFAYNSAIAPNANATQIQAAVTQLFVATNFFHDWYYDVGFNEASGNAQTNNYGRGGLGNDALRAEGQDNGGFGNANMHTPADGQRPVMQMYLWSGGRDGTLDTTIVAHEWGHMISNRLIGNASGLNTLMSVSLGEGWGDFHSLLMMVRSADAQVSSNANWSGAYSIASYVSTGTAGQGLYFGLRRYPYSTDFSKNPLTYKHIQSGVPLPAGVPVQPSPAPNAETHNAGEVWATMLWEVYADLLKDSTRLTFEQAQHRMRSYLVAAYKATPNSPTFTEARDAILASALANDLEDFLLMRKAFARRGLGDFAVSPPRNSFTNIGLVEDFSAPEGLAFTNATLDDSIESCDEDGALDNGEVGKLTVTILNANVQSISAATGTVTAKTPGVIFPNGTSLVFGPSQPFGTTTAQVDVRLDGARGITQLEFSVALADPENPDAQPVTVAFRGNIDERLEASTTDTVEATRTPWTPELGFRHQSSPDFGWKRQELPDGNHVWFGANPTGPGDTRLRSPTLMVSTNQNLVISFRHRFDFETDTDGVRYDGGIVQVRIFGEWTDVAEVGTVTNGYNGRIVDVQGSSNPLSGDLAFTGMSDGYPEFMTTTIDLGTLFAGANTQIRFRIGSDDAVGKKGWEIDDISVSGILNTPFHEAVPQESVCGNTRPVATASAPEVVRSTESVVLTGTATDPDGDPLNYEWTQLEGPTVALTANGSNAEFVAPAVEQEALLRFRLVVWDGKEESLPAEVFVKVQRENRTPVAVLRAPQRVPVGGTLQLDGSTSTDEDGDTLTYEWRQVGGLPLADAIPSEATLTFKAPAKDTTILMELVVSDGRSKSQTAVAEIIVGQGDGIAAKCGCASSSAGGFIPWALLGGVALAFRRRRASTRACAP